MGVDAIGVLDERRMKGTSDNADDSTYQDE